MDSVPDNCCLAAVLLDLSPNQTGNVFSSQLSHSDLPPISPLLPISSPPLAFISQYMKQRDP